MTNFVKCDIWTHFIDSNLKNKNIKNKIWKNDSVALLLSGKEKSHSLFLEILCSFNKTKAEKKLRPELLLPNQDSTTLFSQIIYTSIACYINLVESWQAKHTQTRRIIRGRQHIMFRICSISLGSSSKLSLSQRNRCSCFWNISVDMHMFLMKFNHWVTDSLEYF